MTRWERNCAGLLGRWRRLFQKPYMRWILLATLLGSLVLWDAGYYQVLSTSCRKDSSSCGGLSSQRVSKPLLINERHQRTESSIQNSQRAQSYRVSERKSIYKDLSYVGVAIDHPPAVEAAVAFNDSVLLLLESPVLGLRDAFYRQPQQWRCVFANGVQSNVLNVEDGTVLCSHPENALLRKSLLGSAVTLECNGSALQTKAVYGKLRWKKLVYGFTPVEDEGDLLLFVKGLSHSKKSLSPEGLECQFGDNLRTKVVTFCQENVRCKLPLQENQQEFNGEQVTLVLKNEILPSLVRFLPDAAHAATHGIVLKEDEKPFFLCVCTLVWNGAKFLREWIIYHSYLGVQRFFFYDNNSDDDIDDVLESLNFYNVSRHPWPWLKTQEASFSHCAVRASRQCMWVAFLDLDEFIFPKSFLPPQRNDVVRSPLHSLVKEYDILNKGKLGQLKISNFNFGPSGLKVLPRSGQTMNYICRMSAPQRVKSIVRTSAIHQSYCSRVHYFELKAGYRAASAVRKDAIIHHYKYHVWEDFKLKFVRRAATFVTDWEQNRGMDSFDRTPGLGTEAVEPPDWAHQFCEIEDTSLRDFVRNTSHLHLTGKLVWE